MSSLSAEQIRHLNQMMDQRIDREMREIKAVAARSASDRAQEQLAGKLADLPDSALAEMMAAADYAVVRQDLQDVQDIVAARKRIADGRYGTCIDCGAEIGYARLEAYPTAKRCIGCQEQRERQPRR